MRIMVLAAVLLLAGCLGDDAGDDTGETGTDGPGDGTGSNAPSMGPGGSGNATDAPRQTVQVTVTWEGAFIVPQQGSYDKSEIRVPANSTVELTFVNDDPISDHDIAVDGFENAGADSATIGPDEQITITFDVGSPMTTEFYCTIGNHRQGGMEGAFIVE